MWINLPRTSIETIALLCERNGDVEAANILRGKVKDAFNTDNPKWVEAAKDRHQNDGEVEVDEQSDGSAMISISEDGGAYVLAWVWVYNEEAGFAAKEDEDEAA